MPKKLDNADATASRDVRSVSGVSVLRQFRAMLANSALSALDRIAVEAHLRAIAPARPFAAFRGHGANHVKRRSKPGAAGQRRVDAMQLSTAYSSSVAKLQRRERLVARVKGAA